MKYETVWDDRSRSFLRKIPKLDAQRIIKKINFIAISPKHYLKPLVNINSHKLRIGNYRALIDLNENEKIMSVVLIDHRRDIYKLIKRGNFL